MPTLEEVTDQPAQIILIACEKASLAMLIRSVLLDELSGFHIDVVADGFEETREKLEAREYGWLITWERLATKEIVISNIKEPNGVSLAKEWLARDKRHRAIVVTESCWDKLPWLFAERLTGIPVTQLYPCYPLVEIILAGQAGCTTVPPTVVEFSFFRSRDNNEAYLQLYDVCPGPFKYAVEEALRSADFYEPRQVVGDFNVFAGIFRAAAVTEDSQKRRQSLIKGARKLWRALIEEQPTGLLRSLIKAVESAIRAFPCCSDLSKTQRANGPFPIHLHLICEPDMLAVPIDLILCHPSGIDHLSAHVPITWRIKTNRGMPYRSDGERDHNILKYTSAKVAYSCQRDVQLSGRSFNGLGFVRKEAKQILSMLGLSTKHAKLVTTIGTLRSVLVSRYDAQVQVVHVASHGIHAHPAHFSGIIVGPTKKSGNAGLATAVNLRPNTSEHGPRFAYFNCCELVIQNIGRGSNLSYFGGFAEGAIVEGVCVELVSNRWSVSDKWASLLAIEFYRMRARTAQGRSTALLRARLKLLSEVSDRPDEDQFDSTWLAPIHIWAID